MADESFDSLLRKYLSRGVLFSRSRDKQEQRFEEQYYQERFLKESVGKLEGEFGGLKGKKVLEIGCGTGGLSVALALAGAEVFGVDPEEEGVAAARLRARRYEQLKTNFTVSSGEDLPFSNNLFDALVLNQVMEHVRDVNKVLDESFRVLKPEGRVYFASPNYLWPYEEHYRIFYWPLLPKRLAKIYLKLRGKNPKGIESINYLTPRFLKKRIKEAGFRRIENIGEEELMRKLKNIETINNKRIKSFLFLSQKCGFGALFLRPLSFFAVQVLNFYPNIKLVAEK